MTSTEIAPGTTPDYQPKVLLVDGGDVCCYISEKDGDGEGKCKCKKVKTNIQIILMTFAPNPTVREIKM